MGGRQAPESIDFTHTIYYIVKLIEFRSNQKIDQYFILYIS